MGLSDAGFTGRGKTQMLSFRGVFFAEESLVFLDFERSEIPRFAWNDSSSDFFGNHFSLRHSQGFSVWALIRQEG
ncbi:MAG TPA: hypothetical protein VH161_04755, partial [Candidatus Acidoferrales bacterium]|nr:hypothetical protein [Candidatus Acidoferrales bacterium]